MLEAHLGRGAEARVLKQAPHAFDAVGVHISDNGVIGGVVDRLAAPVGELRYRYSDLQVVAIESLGRRRPACG